MKDSDCIAFLQWALPQLGMRWPGFRKVRRQVCKRVTRRLQLLGLAAPAAYRDFLQAHPDEWAELDRCCRITLSRFYRDRAVFDCLGARVLPVLAQQAQERGSARLEVWSAGCAGGEEPYSLALLWQRCVQPRYPGLGLRIVATDVEPHSLRRAAVGCYSPASLKDLPADWREAAFQQRGSDYCLQQRYRAAVEFLCQDVRRDLPAQHFDLILCRNLAFTYYGLELQQRLLEALLEHLWPRGTLVIGAHETLPPGVPGLTPWSGVQGIFRVETLPGGVTAERVSG